VNQVSRERTDAPQSLREEFHRGGRLQWGMALLTPFAFTTVPLLIIDDSGMRKLASTAAEELLEIVMRRHEGASTLLTSNRPVED
jgi:hypothetical protein